MNKEEMLKKIISYSDSWEEKDFNSVLHTLYPVNMAPIMPMRENTGFSFKTDVAVFEKDQAEWFWAKKDLDKIRQLVKILLCPEPYSLVFFKDCHICFKAESNVFSHGHYWRHVHRIKRVEDAIEVLLLPGIRVGYDFLEHFFFIHSQIYIGISGLVLYTF